MDIINQYNFDWNITNREVVIFVPNFKRRHLLIPTLKRFQTNVPRDQWLILVVNDGIHEDLSDLTKSYNMAYFTLERDRVKERNGCLVRNYVLQRLQSKWLMTKDPEIIIDCDIISRVINLNDVVYRPQTMIELREQETPKILAKPLLDLSQLPILRKWVVTAQMRQAFHNCVCIRTQRLKNMQGYDEAYRDSYGYEDWDMFARLQLSEVPILIDEQVTTYHIWHPIMRRFHRTINTNQIIYDQKVLNLKIIANAGQLWGGGE